MKANRTWLLLAASLLRSGFAHAEFVCKPSPGCEPCEISGADKPDITESELLAQGKACQPGKRRRFAETAVCKGAVGDCQPNYSRAIELLAPLECVVRTGAAECDLPFDWIESIEKGRKLLNELRSLGRLRLSFSHLPEGATVTVQGSACPLQDHRCLREGLPPGNYEVVVSKDQLELAKQTFLVESGKLRDEAWDVKPTVPSPPEAAEVDEPKNEAPPNDDPSHPGTPPPPREPRFGFWGAASMVFDEHGKDSLGARGTLGGEVHVAGPVQLHGGGIFGRRFAGLFAGAGLFWGSGIWQLGPVFDAVILPVSYGDAHGGPLFGAHCALQAGMYVSHDYRMLLDIGLEGYAKAAPYDGFFAVASLGAEWRPR
ncbi:MAG: hypothetical protein ABUL60_36785 [Myxococcales bacterium]